MRLLRSISLFCIMLMIVSVQCRAKCVAVPHETTKQAPECPLHKHKAPETQKCTHAPQWNFDDSKQFVATLEEPSMLLALEFIRPAEIAAIIQPTLSLRPSLILRI